ncbi:MAG: hypothetical protein GKR87_05840 [Kiritimatiellae bacterium]|nr:hypothetical protein [Kiritimatiellia bacterium]
MNIMEHAFTVVRDHFQKAQPTCGLILGSGWSEVIEAFEIHHSIGYEEIPGLGKTGVVGHAGRLVHGICGGLETLIFQGRRHWYEGEGWDPIILPIYVLKKMGVTTLVLTNAAGGVRSDLKPGDLMIIDDHINNMPSNPLIGPHLPIWGPRFPDQTAVYNPDLRNTLEHAAKSVDETLYRGVYLEHLTIEMPR